MHFSWFKAWYKCYVLPPSSAILRMLKLCSGRLNRPSSSKITDSGSRLVPNISQSNSPWTSTGYVSGRLPEIKAHIGPESLSLFSKFLPLAVWRAVLPKVFHHNTKWHFLLWTPRGLPLPLMQPWEIERTVIQTRLWTWTHSAVFSPNESHCFLSLLQYLTLYISLHSICSSFNLVLLPCTNSIPKHRGLFTWTLNLEPRSVDETTVEWKKWAPFQIHPWRTGRSSSARKPVNILLLWILFRATPVKNVHAATALTICLFSGLRSSLFYARTAKFVRAQICVGDVHVFRLQAKGRQQHLGQNIGPKIARSSRPAPPALSERNSIPLKFFIFHARFH